MREKQSGTRGGGCCGPKGMRRHGRGGGLGCCRIEAVVSIDERGQLVLPKDIRERAGIGAGEKLAIIFHGESGGGDKSCCLTLMKADGLAESVRAMLGPMMKEMFHEESK